MSTKTKAAPTADKAASPSVKPFPKTHTDYPTLVRMRWVPTEIQCDGYLPWHRTNEGCHSRVRPRGENVADHARRHRSLFGGGFKFRFQPNSKGGWAGWRKLAEAGMEIINIRCMGCLKDIDINVVDLQAHAKPHLGSNKRIYRNGPSFYITFDSPRPQLTAEEAAGLDEEPEAELENL